MFGSRKNRPPNPALNASTVSPSATTAALTAFRRDSTTSNSSLSAAAAAAALRARPTSPTNVASIQTKRTIRRSASASSSNFTNDHSRGSPSPLNSLRRQSSSGSMIERTFRSPSPGPRQRSQSSGSTPRTPFVMDEAPPPPVPAIPESVNMAAARTRGARPKSLGFVSAPVKTASQRMAEEDKGGSWFGAAKVGDLGNVRTGDAVLRSPSARTTASSSAQQPMPDSPQQEEARPESRGSINFSYPARVRVASPSPEIPEENETPSQKQVHQPAAPKPRKRSSTLSPQRGGSVRYARPASIASDRELVYDPNSRRMIPRAELQLFEHNAQTATEKKPKKKKTALGRAGSHLARGTMGRSHGSAIDNGVPNEAQMAAVASLKSHSVEERQPVREDQEESYEEEPESESTPEPQRQIGRPVSPEPRIRHDEILMSHASNAPEVFSPPLPDQHEGGLQRKPSVVREEREESESEAELEASPSAAAALDAVPVRHSIYAHGVPSPPQSENTDDLAPGELAATSARSPEPILEKPEPRETQNIRRAARAPSNSPVRSAHFGPVQETLTVKHEPPVRSLSPRKSALKRSPSRGASPAGDRSDVSGVDSPTQEPPPPPRKKSVRVSFDDENTIVVAGAAGRVETESPVPPSPQQVTAGGRRPWYSTLGIGRKKDAVPLEEDEVMKPRPALPSFGSVRGRKVSPHPTEERALVRPHDPLQELSESSSPELERRNIPSEDFGQSSDHALGAIINDQSSRIGANVSKQREPLPPVVTSLEGSGFSSDSASSNDEYVDGAETPTLHAEESMVSQASTLVPPRNGTAVEQVDSEARDLSAKHEAVPSISLTQPSPQPEQQGKERESYLRFPGGFPETETETDSGGESATSPPRQMTFEPVVQGEDATATAHTPATVTATHSSFQEPEQESDTSSIYSDAYEDLSEAEGDGFLSLDAVVDSPIATTPPRHVLEKAHAERPESTTPTPQSRHHIDPATSEPADQWAAAKAYWRSLTADKRAQLEKEAADEAGTEGDLEEESQQAEARKPRRKKSVEQRNAEKRTIELQRAVDPSRTYMIKPGTKAGSIDYDDPASSTTAAPRERQQQPNGQTADSGMRLRKTMRPLEEAQAAESGTHFRKSMRPATESQPANTGTHMRQSMRSAPVDQTAPRQRTISDQPLGTTTKFSSTKSKNRHSRAMSENSSISTALIQHTLRRRGSDSSASSFRRARPATSAGEVGFRKTLRASTGGGSFDLPEQRDTTSRFSMRTTSPPVSMRTTLRGERRRSDDSGKGYLRFPGRSGKSEKKGKQKSRFADDSSDDEEATVGRKFTSRYDDSSDEDPVSAKPLPGLGAKTMRSGRKGPPSPPLPEEEEMSDADTSIVVTGSGDKEKAPGVISPARSGRGMDGGRQRRGSFMSSVLRRNKKHEGGAKISRPERTESAARRDTALERSADELAALRSGANSPQLQKRVVSLPMATTALQQQQQQQQQQDWPLTPTAEDAAEDDKDVYDAADGSPKSGLGHSRSQPSLAIAKPGFLMRRSTSATATSNASGSGKKKKFSALRRMFRLDE